MSSTMEEQSVENSTTEMDQSIKVILRIKPLPKEMELTKEQLEAYTIVNSNTLRTKPSTDHNTSSKRCQTNDCREFLFNQTFGPETTQSMLFNETIKMQVADFIAGKNSVVMSYGISNSGKTFTLQGTPESPGLIPRTLEFIFKRINPQPTPAYKLMNEHEVICLDHQDSVKELKLKLELRTFKSDDAKSKCLSVYKNIQRILHDESPEKFSQYYNEKYSVWLSFIEIYNETICDLLWTDSQKKQPKLKLSEDKKGRVYVKGLKSICVCTGAEAYQVFMAGLHNLKVASTALNSRSSRSHSIFILKLLRYRAENDPHSVEVSRFTFCDLAGSERLINTQNIGERLKEAQNINVSLLILRRCLKTVYETQSSTNKKNKTIAPFRESKLTRLFERVFSGKEQMSLIVNVNPILSLFAETQNTLNFSAIAKKIVIIEPIDSFNKRRSRFSRICSESTKMSLDWQNIDLSDIQEEPQNNEVEEQNSQKSHENLIAENQLLKTENELLKKEIEQIKASILKTNLDTRKELTDMCFETMENLDKEWKERLSFEKDAQEIFRDIAVNQVNSAYEKKMEEQSAYFDAKYSCLVEKMKTKDNQIKSLEILLNEAKDDYTYNTDCFDELREQLNKKTELLSEKLEIIFDLKEQLEIAEYSVQNLKEKLATNNLKHDAILEKKINEAADQNKLIECLKKDLDKLNNKLKESEEKQAKSTSERDKLQAEHSKQIRTLKKQLDRANAQCSEQNKTIQNLKKEIDESNNNLETSSNERSGCSRYYLRGCPK